MTPRGERRVPLWVIPFIYTTVSVVAGFVLPRIEQAWIETWALRTTAGSALAFFSAVSSGMMALTGIVFAIAFVTVQFSTSVYSPRLTILFGRDPLIFHTLGLFIATFTYSLAVLAWIDESNAAGAVPALSAYLVIGMLIASMMAFARLIQSIDALQIHNVLQRIGDRGRAVIAAMFPRLDTVAPLPPPDEATLGPATQVLRYDGAPRVITRLDLARLVRIAEKADAVIAMDCAVGDTLVEGATLLRVHGCRDPLREADLIGCIATDTARTFEQDPKYAIRLLVDIAIRALSPAINDPTTAVQVLDQIEDLLNRLSRRALEANTATDAKGRLRLVIQVPSWGDYLALAFDEIRQYGADSVQVMRRLRAALAGMAAGALTEERAAAVRAYRVHLDLTVSRSDLDESDQRNARREDRQGLGLTRGPGA